jgi:hypothetical protein
VLWVWQLLLSGTQNAGVGTNNAELELSGNNKSIAKQLEKFGLMLIL